MSSSTKVVPVLHPNMHPKTASTSAKSTSIISDEYIPLRIPKWLRRPVQTDKSYSETHNALKKNGLHTVCAKVNDDFLEWCKSAGNDLVTPHPEFGFPGLKDGDNWCVCATWFARAVEAGKECKVYLKRTNEKTLKIVPLEILKKHAIDLS